MHLKGRSHKGKITERTKPAEIFRSNHDLLDVNVTCLYFCTDGGGDGAFEIQFLLEFCSKPT